MMDLLDRGWSFFTGIPCNVLSEFINCIENDDMVVHVKPTNEAQAVGLAFGAWLAGKKSVVYLQESGLGYALNPLATLVLPANCNDMMLVISRRYHPYQHEKMANAAETILKSIGWNVEQNVIWVSK